MWFAKKKQEEAKTNELVKDETVEEEIKEEPEKPVEEWIWVEGYKATEADMTCRGYQYEIGELYEMPKDVEIEECVSGFHFCRLLDDVFGFYNIGNNHRFFKVRALVRKEDYERYGKYTKEYEEYLKKSIDSHHLYSAYRTFSGIRYVNKLVAKAIVFESELTPDEILKDRIGGDGWTDEYKRLALELSIDDAIEHMEIDSLVQLGFSRTFAQLIISGDKYETAISVASQPDLSMDMKCWLIFK